MILFLLEYLLKICILNILINQDILIGLMIQNSWQHQDITLDQEINGILIGLIIQNNWQHQNITLDQETNGKSLHIIISHIIHLVVVQHYILIIEEFCLLITLPQILIMFTHQEDISKIAIFSAFKSSKISLHLNNQKLTIVNNIK